MQSLCFTSWTALALWQPTLFVRADACVCVSVSWPWGCQTSCLPFPPPRRSLSPPPPPLPSLLVLNIYSSMGNFYWPSLSDSRLYTLVSFKTSVVSQEGPGLLQFSNSPSSKEMIFSIGRPANDTVGPRHLNAAAVDPWPALAQRCPCCLCMW